MKTKHRIWIGGITLVAAIVLGTVGWIGINVGGIPYWVTVVDYRTPDDQPKDVLEDDRLEDKHAVFDPALVDRREYKQRLVNLSDAVIRLNSPEIKPDAEKELLTLRPSFAAAVVAARKSRTHTEILPSVNLIDGKAKQFDDGLAARIELVVFKGLGDRFPGNLHLIKKLFGKLDPRSRAATYLAAGLELAGEHVKIPSSAEKERLLRDFDADPTVSKPIGFHTWNKELVVLFRFHRFFQRPIDDPAIVAALVKAFRSDDSLTSEYRRSLDFSAKFTNPPPASFLSILNSVVANGTIPLNRSVSIFPPSTSRETELFTRLFPRGLPADVDLMNTLIKRIRSGEVDLTPDPKRSGWYDYQVHALETMLIADRGAEHQRLLLTRSYKGACWKRFNR